MEREKYLKNVFNDPTKAVDFDNDVIEQNLDFLMISNEYHQDVVLS